MRASYLAACCCLALACSDEDPGTTDTRQDTSAGDAAGDTASDTAQAETTDDTAAGADTSDTAEPDDADTAADSADSAGDTAACDYLEELEIIKCGLAHVQVLHWKDFGPGGCADYYSRGDRDYATLEALAAAESCDISCIYIARQAVDFIRCDGQGRSGWESFQADQEGCLEEVIRTEDGIFTDKCLWATYACYCEEPE